MTCDVHYVPGRIRFKVPGLRHDDALISALPRVLSVYDGVERVDVRPASNSLIVHYDPARIDCRHLAQSVNRGLALKTRRRPANGARRPSSRDMREQQEVDGDSFLIGSVRQMGVVFGRTAFKVALEQAVRGGLDSLFRVTFGRR